MTDVTGAIFCEFAHPTPGIPVGPRERQPSTCSLHIEDSVDRFRSRMALFATLLIVLIVLVMFRPDAIMTLYYGAAYFVEKIRP